MHKKNLAKVSPPSPAKCLGRFESSGLLGSLLKDKGCYGRFRKFGVPYFGVLIIRILLTLGSPIVGNSLIGFVSGVRDLGFHSPLQIIQSLQANAWSPGSFTLNPAEFREIAALEFRLCCISMGLLFTRVPLRGVKEVRTIRV